MPALRDPEVARRAVPESTVRDSSSPPAQATRRLSPSTTVLCPECLVPRLGLYESPEPTAPASRASTPAPRSLVGPQRLLERQASCPLTLSTVLPTPAVDSQQ